MQSSSDRDMQPLSVFLEETEKVIDWLKKTGKPIWLTIDGKPELVVMSIESYERLIEETERLKAMK